MTTVEALQHDLAGLIGDERRVSAGTSVRALHGHDSSYHEPQLPDVVVFAADADEISRLLAYANERCIPVIPFGAGTSIDGHIIPTRSGTISIDLSSMTEITVLADDLMVVVQPGVLREQLNERLADHGLHFPVDPGANASLGGMAATNASGTTAVRYGSMRDQVLGLTVVLADGSIVRTGGRIVKTSAGYNLTSLFVGSEGTLGVITELVLRVYGIPEQIVAVRAVFPDIDAACRAASTTIASGAVLNRCEFVDAFTVAAVNAHSGTAFVEAPSLFVEFAGGHAAVAADIELTRSLFSDEGCTRFEAETSIEARNRLWAARHQVAEAIQATGPGKVRKSTDVTVPVSRVAEAVRWTRAELDRLGVQAALLGHIGDGNYHTVFMVDPERPEELALAKQIETQQIEHALALGGTCSGEHGIGIGKIGYLELEHGDAIPLMRGIKDFVDPSGIMNPGKILRS